MPGKKILVADDSLTIQKVIRLALSNEGYEIQAVSEGNDAVQQISVFRPDVVLIDVSLPNRSAFEVKAEVDGHADLSQVRFVLMSSAFEKVDEVAVDRSRFHGRLTKPFDPAHLRQVLQSALASQNQDAHEPPPAPRDITSEFEISLAPPEPDEFVSEKVFTRPKMSTPPKLPPKLEPKLENDIWEETPSSIVENEDENDIRGLTEKTIRMSGLDEFKGEFKGDLKSDLKSDFKADFEWSVQEPSLKPLPKMLEPEAPPLDIPSTPNLTRSKIDENLVRRELEQGLQETLERMARELLPEIAERVIKQEIHRLLSERP